jgi:hypothetical protein
MESCPKANIDGFNSTSNCLFFFFFFFFFFVFLELLLLFLISNCNYFIINFSCQIKIILPQFMNFLDYFLNFHFLDLHYL